jgi:hypothetical protein
VHLHQVQVQGTGCMISKDALRKCKNRKATWTYQIYSRRPVAKEDACAIPWLSAFRPDVDLYSGSTWSSDTTRSEYLSWYWLVLWVYLTEWHYLNDTLSVPSSVDPCTSPDTFTSGLWNDIIRYQRRTDRVRSCPKRSKVLWYRKYRSENFLMISAALSGFIVMIFPIVKLFGWNWWMSCQDLQPLTFLNHDSS